MLRQMRMLSCFMGAGAACLALAVFAGFAGRLHPVFDSLSLLRLPLALACLCILVFPMGRRLRLTLAAAAVAGLATTIPFFFAGKTDSDLRVYSKNLWYRNATLTAVADDIRASGADVVMLQEVSRNNTFLMRALDDTYPHQHLCGFSGWSGLAVLSRQPILNTACSDGRSAAAAQIALPDGPVWAVSVHLTWPFPYSNAASAQRAVDLIAGLDGPVVMGGDFNIFPWAGSVQQLQAAANLQAAQPIRPTYDLQGIPLLLDHIHAPGGGQASYRPLLGSDHRGVLADVALSAPSRQGHEGILSGFHSLFR